METNKMKRTTNRVQFEQMVRMMKEHPDIAKNLTKGTVEAVQIFWQTIRDELNSLGPPIKEIVEWKMVWSDFKSSLREKFSQSRREHSKITFSSLDEEVIQLLCLRDCVEGVANANKFGVPLKRTCNPDDASRNPTQENIRTATEIQDSPLREEEADIEGVDSVGMETHTEAESNQIRGPKQLRLLEKQVNIQEQLYNNIKEFTKNQNERSEDGNLNQKKMYRALDKINDRQKQIKEIIEALLEENKRHHLKMEQLALEKNKLKQQILEIELKKLN